MSVSHLQVNKNGTIEDRRTLLWPSSKVSQKDIIKSLSEFCPENYWKLAASKRLKELNSLSENQ